MFEYMENSVLGHETGLYFDFLRFDRTKTCRILRPFRISQRKQMKYVKTAPKNGLTFLCYMLLGALWAICSN